MSNNYSDKTRAITLLDGVTATGAGEWFYLPANKTFEVEGITTATVEIQYRNDENATAKTMYSFTADGAQANFDPVVQVRANVTAYTSGTITVTAGITENDASTYN